MKRILIIEDEEIAAARLMQMVARLIPDAVFDGPLESVSQSVSYLRSNSAPDLIFLDIQLADGLSFNIFQQVKVLSPVIFTTAFDEYAIRAFELNSIDYLLKPIDNQKLAASINKYSSISQFYSFGNDKMYFEILKTMSSNQNSYKKRFLVSKGDVLVPLSVDEIAYFLAEDKLVFLYTVDGRKYIVNYSLDALETQLDPQQFFRVNRHCILNSISIVKVHSFFNYQLKVEVVPSISGELLVSRSRSANFKNWLGN